MASAPQRLLPTLRDVKLCPFIVFDTPFFQPVWVQALWGQKLQPSGDDCVEVAASPTHVVRLCLSTHLRGKYRGLNQSGRQCPSSENIRLTSDWLRGRHEKKKKKSQKEKHQFHNFGMKTKNIFKCDVSQNRFPWHLFCTIYGSRGINWLIDAILHLCICLVTSRESTRIGWKCICQIFLVDTSKNWRCSCRFRLFFAAS